jgi:hypothetical protein
MTQNQALLLIIVVFAGVVGVVQLAERSRDDNTPEARAYYKAQSAKPSLPAPRVVEEPWQDKLQKLRDGRPAR